MKRMAVWLLLLGGVAALLVPVTSEASGPSCWLWPYAGGFYSSLDAAGGAWRSDPGQTDFRTVSAGPNGGGYQSAGGPSCTVDSVGPPGSGTCTVVVTVGFVYSSGATDPEQRHNDTAGFTQVQHECPPPDPCAAKSGQQASFTTNGGGGCASVTKDDQGCAMQSMVSVRVGGSCAITGTYTGSQDSSPTTPTGNPGSCVTGSGGTVCTEGPQGKNCGTFNGDEVCVASVPPGSCQSFASGGVACTASPGTTAVPSPPGPDNGTSGQPATPTGSVSTVSSASGSNVTTTTNYYNSTTVGGSGAGVSSNPGGQNVGNGGTGSGSGGSGSGDGGGTPSAANGDCGADGVDCGGDGSTPELPTQATMQDSLQTYYSALEAVPVVAAFSGLAGSLPTGGECPTTQFEVFGKTFTMDVQCTLWASIQGVLSLVMLAVWTIVGVRVLMSA